MSKKEPESVSRLVKEKNILGWDNQIDWIAHVATFKEEAKSQPEEIKIGNIISMLVRIARSKNKDISLVKSLLADYDLDKRKEIVENAREYLRLDEMSNRNMQIAFTKAKALFKERDYTQEQRAVALKELRFSDFDIEEAEYLLLIEDKRKTPSLVELMMMVVRT